jgi:hypothetical protein
MKAGFYDKKTHSMMSVEPWTEGIETARLASTHMALMYQSGRHRMPSPVWCVWDETGHVSIFFLDNQSVGDMAFMDSISELMV